VGPQLALLRRAHATQDRDFAVADPGHGAAAAARLHDLARTRLPARHDRRDALPDLPPGRGARSRPPDPPRRRQRPPADADARALRRGARGPLPHALLPVYGALDGAGRLLLPLQWRGLPGLQVLGLDRDGGLRDGRPGRARVRRLRPRGVLRLRLRSWPRAHGPAPPRRARREAPLAVRPRGPDAVLIR